MSAMEAKIAAAVAMDALFETYQAAVTPAEALELVRRLPALGKADPATLEGLVSAINSEVPPLSFGHGSRASGRPGHLFHIGRANRRLVVVDLLTAYWPDMARRKKIRIQLYIIAAAEQAGAHVTIEDEDPDTVRSVRMLWD